MGSGPRIHGGSPTMWRDEALVRTRLEDIEHAAARRRQVRGDALPDAPTRSPQPGAAIVRLAHGVSRAVRALLPGISATDARVIAIQRLDQASGAAADIGPAPRAVAATASPASGPTAPRLGTLPRTTGERHAHRSRHPRPARRSRSRRRTRARGRPERPGALRGRVP